MTISLSNLIESTELYGGAIARLDHGLLVVASPDSVDSHTGWDPAVDPIHAGRDSIYVSAQQAASGPVAVVCVAGPYAPQGLELLFAGRIELSRPTLSICDPNDVVNLRLPVDGAVNRVEIYGDAADESGQLVIVLTNFDE